MTMEHTLLMLYEGEPLKLTLNDCLVSGFNVFTEQMQQSIGINSGTNAKYSALVKDEETMMRKWWNLI